MGGGGWEQGVSCVSIRFFVDILLVVVSMDLTNSLFWMLSVVFEIRCSLFLHYSLLIALVSPDNAIFHPFLVDLRF